MAEKFSGAEIIFVKFCRAFGKGGAVASGELVRAVEFLGWDIGAENVAAASIKLALLSFAVVSIMVLPALMAGVSMLVFVFLFPLCAMLPLIITEWPKSLAGQKAMRDLSSAPYTITQICISLKQAPNLENALGFVAKNGRGGIALDIKEALWLLWAGKISSASSLLEGVACKWGRFSSGFQRSVQLINSSFLERDKNKKTAVLDKAVDVMLSDITKKMTDFAGSLQMPTLVIFSMGTIMPLMVISLFPVVSIFGFSVSHLHITLFLAVSLVGCYLYSALSLRKRPAGVSMHECGEKRPEHIIPLALSLAVLISIPSIFYLMSLSGTHFTGIPGILVGNFGGLGLVWGLGVSVSVYAYMTSFEERKTRKKALEEEGQFIDSLFHIKNRLGDGRPIESAMEFAASSMKDSSASLMLERIVNRIKRKQMSFREAVKEEKSASCLTNFILSMIVAASSKGREAMAQTASIVHDYMERLMRIENDMLAMLNKSVSMMKATILLFAPVVCAVIVTLFRLVTEAVKSASREFSGYGIGQTFLTPAIEPMMLELIVGIYTVLLNIVLLKYISGLQYGADRTAFMYDLSRYLPVTLVIFTATLAISGIALRIM
jgi:uncharacterized membrane protein